MDTLTRLQNMRIARTEANVTADNYMRAADGKDSDTREFYRDMENEYRKMSRRITENMEDLLKIMR